MKHLIIDRPGRQTTRQRLLFGSMTVLFWALWLYLWLPALALFGWILGFKIAYDQMVVRNGYTGLLELLGFYLTVIVFFGASLLAWAYYNLARFRGSGRRKQVPIASGSAASERYGIAQERLIEWRGARRLVLRHDAQGHLLGEAVAGAPELYRTE